MYQTKIFGGFGKTSSPIEGAWGHYSYGIYHEKEQAATPFMITTNGSIEREAGADSRFSGHIGRATVPCVPILQDIEMRGLMKEFNTTKAQIGAFLDKMNRPEVSGIHSTHEYMDIRYGSTGEEPSGNPTVEDFLVQTWPKVQQRAIVGFKDMYYRYFIAMKPHLIEMLNDIQAEITDIVRVVKGAPTLAKVGYGMASRGKTGLSLERRPSRYTRFKDNTAKLDITIDPFPNTPLRSQAAYMHILGQQLKNMMTYNYKDGRGPGIKQFTDADYAAMANSLILQSSGSGEIKVDKTYSAADISEQVLHMIGHNIAEAYPFLPDEDEAWEELIEFYILWGIVGARVKATTLMGEVNLHSARNGIRAPYEFERYTKPNFENYGSLGTPYYFMARNSLRGDFPIPCVMLYDDQDREYGLEGNAMDSPNVYDVLMQKQNVKFTTADVSRGEVAGSVLDPLTEDQFVKLVIHPDVRILDVEYSMQALRIYKIPAFTIMQADGMNQALRVQLFLLNLFSNGKQNLKEGYVMNPGIGMFDVSKIQTYVNSIAQEIIIKDDTNASSPQMASPNTSLPGHSSKVRVPEAEDKTKNDGPMTPIEKAGIVNQPVNAAQAEEEAVEK
jgi:hypothetical protein